MPRSLPARVPVWDTVTVPHRLTLGLRALAHEDPWLELDEDLECDLREKHVLLRDRHSQVFVELPESMSSQRETFSLIADTLLTRHPELYSKQGSRLRVHATDELVELDDPARSPLESASRCVQEDLVVMQERPRGWCLTAASVCFPTRWDLPIQLGRPMGTIHEPVPGYQEQLDVSSNRFFDGTKPGIVYRRGNWSLLDDPTLFQPTRKLQRDAGVALNASNAGQQVWLRVEHQTLQRLPETGAILFTIRIHRTRLDAVAREPGAARSLVGAIETMHPAMQRYKSLGIVRNATLGYLGRTIEAM
ncbi:MAG: DUF3445 domain-containing protein [Deltaproteobacteria bacterium]|nr:DUF3445 domain-containing protein [Deltaproteobacteria bacterium]